MELISIKRSLPVLFGFGAVAIVIAIAFVMGGLSAQKTGVSYLILCVAATIILTYVFTSRQSIPKESSTNHIDPVTRKKVLGTIRSCKIAIAVMPLVLVFGLWETRGGPFLPRFVGAAVNVAITCLFFVAMQRQMKKLRK